RAEAEKKSTAQSPSASRPEVARAPASRPILSAAKDRSSAHRVENGRPPTREAAHGVVPYPVREEMLPERRPGRPGELHDREVAHAEAEVGIGRKSLGTALARSDLAPGDHVVVRVHGHDAAPVDVVPTEVG